MISAWIQNRKPRGCGDVCIPHTFLNMFHFCYRSVEEGNVVFNGSSGSGERVRVFSSNNNVSVRILKRNVINLEYDSLISPYCILTHLTKIGFYSNLRLSLWCKIFSSWKFLTLIGTSLILPERWGKQEKET